MLVVLLGLTWTFGLLFLSAETATFAYIFTILNSLQGFFIFVFHCIMNEKVSAWLQLEQLSVKVTDERSWRFR